MPKLMEILFGKKDKMSQAPLMTRDQQLGLKDLFGQLNNMRGFGGSYSGAQNYLSDILSNDPNAFAQFEAPYRQQFEQQILPGIAERFGGMNAMGGGLSSSGFGQALGGAGAQLQAQLAGLHGALRQNATGQALGQYNQMAGLGLSARPFENLYQPGSTGIVGGTLQGLASGLGSGFGLGAGGGMWNSLLGLFGNKTS